jgi:hypothetical protein
MSKELQPVDITASPDLLRLAEEVERSGVGRLLKRGHREVAVITPVQSQGTAPKRARRRAAASANQDSILNIIGIGESAEPTDMARHKHEYVAEAYDVKPSP